MAIGPHRVDPLCRCARGRIRRWCQRRIEKRENVKWRSTMKDSETMEREESWVQVNEATEGWPGREKEKKKEKGKRKKRKKRKRGKMRVIQ